jgi:HJR/Mrr/RecB family endonuclease
MPSLVLGHLLRDLMVRKRLTASAVASRSGVSRTTIHSWLSGHVCPTAGTAWKLAQSIPEEADRILLAALSTAHTREEDREPDGLPIDLRRFAREFFLSSLAVNNVPINDLRAYERKAQDVVARLFDSRFGQSLPPAGMATDEIELETESDIIILPQPSLSVLATWKEIAVAIAKDSRRLYSISAPAFEELVARLLQTFGWEVDIVARSGDDGIDAIATRLVKPDITIRMMVQAKRYAAHRKVGIDQVRELWAVKWKHGFHDALLATSSSFTRGAKDQAEQWRLTLRDHDAITLWAREFANGVATTTSGQPAPLPNGNEGKPPV